MTDRTQPRPPSTGAEKKTFAHKALKTSLWSNDTALTIKSVAENCYRLSGRVLREGAILNLKVTGQNFKIPMEATDKMEAVDNRLKANLPRGLSGKVDPVENTAPEQFDISLARKDGR